MNCVVFVKTPKMVSRNFDAKMEFLTNIDFYSALEVVRNNRQFFNNLLKFSFDKNLAREMIHRK